MLLPDIKTVMKNDDMCTPLQNSKLITQRGKPFRGTTFTDVSTNELEFL